ncbi:unnamed protein product [Rotaria sp. Silwood1]|nr:unnamed protein product [Rotaria sp. Silwood1]
MILIYSKNGIQWKDDLEDSSFESNAIDNLVMASDDIKIRINQEIESSNVEDLLVLTSSEVGTNVREPADSNLIEDFISSQNDTIQHLRLANDDITGHICFSRTSEKIFELGDSELYFTDNFNGVVEETIENDTDSILESPYKRKKIQVRTLSINCHEHQFDDLTL